MNATAVGGEGYIMIYESQDESQRIATHCPQTEHIIRLFQVVAPINKMIDTVPFNVLTYSLDWHPSDHLSFDDNVTLRKLHESSPVGDPKFSLCLINTISLRHQIEQEERIFELDLNSVCYRHPYVSPSYKATVRTAQCHIEGPLVIAFLPVDFRREAFCCSKPRLGSTCYSRFHFRQ